MESTSQYIVPREEIVSQLGLNPHTFSWYLGLLRKKLPGYTRYKPYQKYFDQITVEILVDMVSLFKSGKTQKQVLAQIKEKYPRREVKTCTFTKLQNP